VIDLHLHTTASDGRLTPTQLVAQATACGVRTLAVTDHDTTDGFGEAAAEAARLGAVVVPGIEITAVEGGRDVHMLGYFFDRGDTRLGEFLAAQRATRVARIIEMADRLAALGMPVDVPALLDEVRTHTSKSIGRPRLARAMIDAGYVTTTREAFDGWLGQGRPAFVERAGASPEEVIALVHSAGGIISLAHPGRTQIDDRIADLRDAGLDAVEAHHSDHDSVLAAFYVAMARQLGLLVTGGSDFHGDPAQKLQPGACVLPEPDWERLQSARGKHAR
jgi:predicted metal-dependent phosphoesterase TrpH